MDKNKIIEIASDVENKSNNSLIETQFALEEEFTKTKDLIISLTHHLDSVEELYNKVNEEIEKRKIK